MDTNKRELNKQKSKYEGILIDIIFNLLDIEDQLERNDFHPHDLQDRIKKIKENIGKELSDWHPNWINPYISPCNCNDLILIYT